MPKTLYVLRGPCGSGKTWLRTHLFAGTDTPVIDMQDAPHDLPYAKRVIWLKRQLAAEHGHCILEGIFAPGTPSWKQLQTIAPSYGFDIVSITITLPKAACLRSVEGDEIRTRFVEQYYDKFV